jgi:hypothetical protein
LSDRKLKPLPPDPFRHQDSAIAHVGLSIADLMIEIGEDMAWR